MSALRGQALLVKYVALRDMADTCSPRDPGVGELLPRLPEQVSLRRAVECYPTMRTPPTECTSLPTARYPQAICTRLTTH